MSETPSQRAMTDVDRVAEAIWRAGFPRESADRAWRDLVNKQHYRAQAVAAIDTLGLTEEWTDDVAGPEWQRYRRLVTAPVAYPGPKRVAAGLEG